MELKRVVVTGLGALTPVGNTCLDTWNTLLAGKSGAAPITHFDASQQKTRFACELKGFDPINHFDKKDIKKYDPYVQYALVATEEAVRDAGIDDDKVNKDRVGVIWATGIGGFFTIEEEMFKYFQATERARYSPFFIAKLIPNMGSGMISIRFGFKGPNYAVSSACSSSTHAILDAYNTIRLNKADIMVTGGSEASIVESAVAGFNSSKALSERNDSPETASRPFDKTRDGFVMGEGAGALILEEYEHAKARNAKIYAEILGCGCSADAYHMTAPDPEGYGVSLAMQSALDEAGLKSADIHYLNMHATSTGLGDIAESLAIYNTFNGELSNLCVSATKSMTGHLLGAAGAVESIVCIKSIQTGEIPPTINCREVDPEIRLGASIILDKPLKRDIRTAMCNNFGFGGHNASLIFAEAL